MKYDSRYHITADEIAERLGIPIVSVPGYLAVTEAPRVIGRRMIDGKRQRIYSRGDFEAWLGSRAPEIDEEVYVGEIVPPSDVREWKRSREYTPSDALRLNEARAAELYPHRLVTPEGTGNYREYATNALRDW